ncbi:hypothetical protein J6590_061636 [Homalodisca vitripennis]|nr:hypothetical protein J6590_061636 [Homalodisca vitripennis]
MKLLIPTFLSLNNVNSLRQQRRNCNANVRWYSKEVGSILPNQYVSGCDPSLNCMSPTVVIVVNRKHQQNIRKQFMCSTSEGRQNVILSACSGQLDYRRSLTEHAQLPPADSVLGRYLWSAQESQDTVTISSFVLLPVLSTLFNQEVLGGCPACPQTRSSGACQDSRPRHSRADPFFHN